MDETNVQPNPGGGLIAQMEGWLKTEETAIAAKLKSVAVAAWAIIKEGLEDVAKELPGIVIQGVMAAENAPAGANKKDVAAKSILSGLESAGISAAVSSATDNVAAVAAATGLDANTVDNAITSAVGMLRAKGVISAAS